MEMIMHIHTSMVLLYPFPLNFCINVERENQMPCHSMCKLMKDLGSRGNVLAQRNIERECIQSIQDKK